MELNVNEFASVLTGAFEFCLHMQREEERKECFIAGCLLSEIYLLSDLAAIELTSVLSIDLSVLIWSVASLSSKF